MQQQEITYYDGQDKLIGQLISDQNKKQKTATVIVFPAFEGCSEFAIEYGHKLAEQGFVAFVADMYGNGEVADSIEGCFKLITPFLQDRGLVRRRANLAFEAASTLEPVDASNIGAIGFCFGGMCGLEVARSVMPLKALVSAHGVLAKSDLPTEAIESKITILHGFKDPQVPPESFFAFANEMEMAGVDDWSFTFIGSAKHSYTDPRTGTYDKEKEDEMGREYNETAAKRTFRWAVDFFKETLI